MTMLSNMLQCRDLPHSHVNLWLVVSDREINQLLYLWYQSTGFYLYNSEKHGRLHWNSISLSISVIFASEFLDQNHVTATIPTKSTKNMDSRILLGKHAVSVSVCIYMAQYSTQGMFICYIFQKKMGVVQLFTFGESITDKVVLDIQL